jgi:hypothetical protein
MSDYQTSEERFWSKVDKSGDCWLWQGCHLKRTNQKISYGQVRFKNELIYAHRLAWEFTFGPVPEGKEICHHCDNPICVRPSHLFLGTHLDNMQDASGKGRMWTPSGEDCSHSKLTATQVKEIKNSPLTQRKLAEQYHVSQSAIFFILKGRNWKGVAV